MKSIVAMLVIIAVLVSLIMPRPSTAQLAVHDLGVMSQMLLSVASLAQLVGLNIRDLQTLANLGPILALGQRLVVLSGQLIGIGQSIVAFSEGMVQLGGGSFCQTTEGVEWYSQALQFARGGSIRVLQIQGILGQMQDVVGNLTQIVLLLQTIQGTTSGLQANGALLSIVSSEIMRLQVALTPTYQLMAATGLIDQVIALNSWCLRNNRFGSWGKY